MSNAEHRPNTRQARRQLLSALIPVALFLALASFGLRTVAPTQEEVFGREYRINVVCGHEQLDGELVDIYCLQSGDRASSEKVVRAGPFALRSSRIRPEMELQIGSLILPVLEQSYQGAAYAGLIKIGTALLGRNVYGLRIPLICCGVLSLLFTFLLIRQQFGFAAGFAAEVCTACFHITAGFFSSVVHLQSFYVFSLLAMLYLLLKPVDRIKRRPRGHALLLGLSAGVMIYNNVLCGSVAAALLGSAILFRRDRLLVYVRYWYAALPGLLLPLIPLIAFNMLFRQATVDLISGSLGQMAANPALFLQALIQRISQTYYVLQGIPRIAVGLGVIDGIESPSSLGFEYFFLLCLAALLLAPSSRRGERAAGLRMLGTSFVLVVFFSSFTTMGTTLNMLYLMQPLVPLVAALGALEIAAGISTLTGGRASRTPAVLLVTVTLIMELYITADYIRVLPLFRTTWTPLAVQNELAGYLESNGIDDAVDVHIEDLRYPIEFLTHNRVQLKHHFTFKGPRGWDRKSEEIEWDSVIRLNRGRRFVLLSLSFSGLSSDVQLFREACQRNGVPYQHLRTFANDAGIPVFEVYRIE